MGQKYEKLIISLDRTPEDAYSTHPLYRDAYKIRNDGVGDGWNNPCKIINAAFREVDTDLTCLIHSDVVLEPDALENMREVLQEESGIVIGNVRESAPSHPGTCGRSEITGAGTPRFLYHFIVMPTSVVRREIDESFVSGYCLDDFDWFCRQSECGVDILWYDGAKAIHQSHDRGYLDPNLVDPNTNLFKSRWGKLHNNPANIVMMKGKFRGAKITKLPPTAFSKWRA